MTAKYKKYGRSSAPVLKSRYAANELKVIISFKFRRMGNLIDARSLSALAVDPDLDEPFGEYSAFGKVIMIRFESVESFVKALGKAVNLGLLLLGKIKEVEIVGSPSRWRRGLSR